ncbi:hypothetical protein SAMN02745181_1167 [Rubritalea squalenifaciens DSM 18772]|uniref:Spheroidene monooxygenase n=1 Tax=Rubritalea squalenifaciens DSM 18772 TaxID=1123071 RepID=A0A1M6GGV4_9BACT|nr:hypothetical protein [Rubritalea squalenifaciens]SHJ09169.1 hypothetical protein SAMN02745181_1167 [Rubritalea squalenifaciens DSM 18772]
MQIFSLHLLETTAATTLGVMLRPPTRRNTAGLLHAECMAAMRLGSPILSPARLQMRKLAVFASWESEQALDDYLTGTKLGRKLAEGWHVRLEFLRQWGEFSDFKDLPPAVVDADPEQPIVAVTLARLNLTQLSRFIHWGKPVEELVRDHPGTTLAMAAVRPPRTFSTISVWRSQREMTDMVHGRNSCPGAERHAMAERKHKDFHHKFTTFRFRAISEHGKWRGKSGIVPAKE